MCVSFEFINGSYDENDDKSYDTRGIKKFLKSPRSNFRRLFIIIHPCNKFGMWTVNRKWVEMCDFHSDYVKMSYGSHIKIKILAGLLLGDFKNFLIPPRIIYYSVKIIR